MAVFAPSGSASQSGSGTTGTVVSPAIQNVTLTTAGTEYSIVIPADTKRFTIKSRQDSILKLSYTSGDTGINYFTIGYGVCYTEVNLDGSGLTLYLQSNKNGTVIEVLSWE